jgi:hypothetical protein
MTSFGTVERNRPDVISDEPKADMSSDAAWMVLEAANDIGDHDTVNACRRVIDANLNGRPASPSDLRIVLDYFR